MQQQNSLSSTPSRQRHFFGEAGICRCSEGACVGSGGVVVWQERNIHNIHPFAISRCINIYASHTTSKEV